MDKQPSTHLVKTDRPCPLLTVREVSEILNISKSFAYQLIHAGEIPHVKIGSALRVKAEDLEQYINANTSPLKFSSRW